MKKPAKLKRLVSRPMQIRYLAASDENRQAMRQLIEEESQWRINKMQKRGFRLEATVDDVFGLFTRGPARGKVKLVSAEATAS